MTPKTPSLSLSSPVHPPMIADPLVNHFPQQNVILHITFDYMLQQLVRPSNFTVSLMDKCLYEFEGRDIEGRAVLFQSLRGKVVIVVNVASLCGFAPQYGDLQRMYQKYGGSLVILAFPCNQFGQEEPLDGLDLSKHIRSHFGISFPIMAKCEVNGDYEDPLFTHLKAQQPSRFGFRGVQWNFEKFVINSKGKVVGRFIGLVAPSSFENLVDALIEELEREKKASEVVLKEEVIKKEQL